MSKAIDNLVNTMATQARIIESLGVPFTDPFNEVAIISDVNDPKKLGRVKVIADDGITSHWIRVSGSNKGTLSARFIGSRVLIGKINGRSENMYVIGILNNDPESGVNGMPIQLPLIDESTEVWNNTTDSGMKCNEGNQGRVYILSNEMNQDVVVCLRRDNPQTGSDPVWAWKSLTNGLWVEKGINPGNSSEEFITQAQEKNPGIPKCDESLLGEIHDFTEDRKFRTTTLQCRRDENGGFTWMPLSAPPVVFKTTLPQCTESVHGMEAILDDGNNSEFLICQRYQGVMRWAKQGRRIVHKFYPLDNPPTRGEFLETFNPIGALEGGADEGGYDWITNDIDLALAILDKVISFIPLTNTDPRLESLLELANLIPRNAFNGADVLVEAANEAVRRKSGFPITTIINQIRGELDEFGEITPELSQVLKGLGEAGTVLLEGSKQGTVNDSLLDIGKNTLINSLSVIEPQSASVLYGLMAGGIWGAVDSATALGLDKLPPETSKYVAPIVDIARELIKEYPKSLGDVLTSSVNGGLKTLVSGELNKLIGSNIVSPQLIDKVGNLLSSGSLGEVGKLFNSFSNLKEIATTFGGLPVLSSTLLGALGVEGSVASLIGTGAGIGLEGLSLLLGEETNPTALILAGVSGLSSLLSGFTPKGGCPCDPKCRKVSHGRDSDGVELLEKCGALTRNNANAYSPTGFPIPNNIGDVAKSLGLNPTDVGKNLLPGNIRDFSSVISTVSRVKDMAESFYASRNADDAEREAEMAYTFEAIEKSLKVLENNITRVESVEKNLIDSAYNLVKEIVDKPGGAILEKLIIDARENAQAIKDLYGFVKALDIVKKGKSARVNVTPSIQSSFNNIPDLSKLSKKNKKEAAKILSLGVAPAYADWRSMTDLDSALGAYIDTIPDPFPSERTLFDEPRVVSISLESKILEDSNENDQIFNRILSPNQIQSLKDSFFDRGDGTYKSISSDLVEDQPLIDDRGQEKVLSVYDEVIAREGNINCG
jgi:hypothetical protein